MIFATTIFPFLTSQRVTSIDRVIKLYFFATIWMKWNKNPRTISIESLLQNATSLR